MRDPRTRVLEEAPTLEVRAPHRAVTWYRTSHAPPLGSVLDALREQLIEAVPLSFFDGGANVEVTPVVKRALSEAGAATIVARKREPAFEADVALQVRSDHVAPTDPADIGRYQVAARAWVRCDDQRGRTEREVDVTVREIEGMLQLDVSSLRAEMAAAIRSIESVPSATRADSSP